MAFIPLELSFWQGLLWLLWGWRLYSPPTQGFTVLIQSYSFLFLTIFQFVPGGFASLLSQRDHLQGYHNEMQHLTQKSLEKARQTLWRDPHYLLNIDEITSQYLPQNSRIISFILWNRDIYIKGRPTVIGFWQVSYGFCKCSEYLFSFVINECSQFEDSGAGL